MSNKTVLRLIIRAYYLHLTNKGVIFFIFRTRLWAPSVWNSASWSSTGRVQQPGSDCWSSLSNRSKVLQEEFSTRTPPSLRLPLVQKQQQV